jgi:predicted DNA-binding ribbon-helix-helix protein
MIAAEHGMTVKKLIEEIISLKGTDPLSSTLRVYVANHFYREYPRVGYVDPHSRFVLVVAKKGRRARAARAKARSFDSIEFGAACVCCRLLLRLAAALRTG